MGSSKGSGVRTLHLVPRHERLEVGVGPVRAALQQRLHLARAVLHHPPLELRPLRQPLHDHRRLRLRGGLLDTHPTPPGGGGGEHQHTNPTVVIQRRKKWRIAILGFGTARQKMVLE
jgi:hypothetical protein